MGDLVQRIDTVFYKLQSYIIFMKKKASSITYEQRKLSEITKYSKDSQSFPIFSFIKRFYQNVRNVEMVFLFP